MDRNEEERRRARLTLYFAIAALIITALVFLWVTRSTFAAPGSSGSPSPNMSPTAIVATSGPAVSPMPLPQRIFPEG